MWLWNTLKSKVIVSSTQIILNPLVLGGNLSKFFLHKNPKSEMFSAQMLFHKIDLRRSTPTSNSRYLYSSLVIHVGIIIGITWFISYDTIFMVY
jgi:hypothetical protein